jgi:hypothetical protein
VRRFFWAKALRFGANGGDACGCRNPDGGAIVVTFSPLKLRVKTIDHAVSMMATRCLISLLGVSLWSSEFLGLMLVSSVASFGYPCIFSLSLICLLGVFLITLYRFDRCGFTYKAWRKPVSRD